MKIATVKQNLQLQNAMRMKQKGEIGNSKDKKTNELQMKLELNNSSKQKLICNNNGKQNSIHKRREENESKT